MNEEARPAFRVPFADDHTAVLVHANYPDDASFEYFVTHADRGRHGYLATSPVPAIEARGLAGRRKRRDLRRDPRLRCSPQSPLRNPAGARHHARAERETRPRSRRLARLAGGRRVRGQPDSSAALLVIALPMSAELFHVIASIVCRHGRRGSLGQPLPDAACPPQDARPAHRARSRPSATQDAGRGRRLSHPLTSAFSRREAMADTGVPEGLHRRPVPGDGLLLLLLRADVCQLAGVQLQHAGGNSVVVPEPRPVGLAVHPTAGGAGMRELLAVRRPGRRVREGAGHGRSGTRLRHVNGSRWLKGPPVRRPPGARAPSASSPR